MSRATIITNYGGGKYRVRLNLDTRKTDADLKSMTLQIETNDSNITKEETKLADLKSDQAQKIAILNNLIATGTFEQIQEYNHVVLAANLAVGKQESVIAILVLGGITLSKRSRYLQLNVPEDLEKDIWCVDHTDDLSAGGEDEGEPAIVGTLEVPTRYSNINAGYNTTAKNQFSVYIKPGGSDGSKTGWVGTPEEEEPRDPDGVMQPSICGTSWGVYYSAAMNPGTQKWRPGYRAGTLTDVEKGRVVLHDAIVKGGRKYFDVNQSGVLEKCRYDYMGGGSDTFKKDDQVVIKFADRDWSKPVIIGFVSEPVNREINPPLANDIDWSLFKFARVASGVKTGTGPRGVKADVILDGHLSLSQPPKLLVAEGDIDHAFGEVYIQWEVPVIHRMYEAGCSFSVTVSGTSSFYHVAVGVGIFDEGGKTVASGQTVSFQLSGSESSPSLPTFYVRVRSTIIESNGFIKMELSDIRSR